MEEDNNIIKEEGNHITEMPIEQKTTPAEPTCKSNKCCNTLLSIGVIVSIIGIIVLFIFHFTSINNSKVNADATVPVQKEGGLTIAYIDTDTLLAKYQYAIELDKELKAYQKQQQDYYQQQVTSYQNDYQNYLKNGASMTLSQQQAKENELKERAGKIATMEQDIMAKLQERQLNETTKLQNAVNAFIREYNAANQQFDVIMTKSFVNSPTLYMNPAMNITNEIVKGLNDEYETIRKNGK